MAERGSRNKAAKAQSVLLVSVAQILFCFLTLAASRAEVKDTASPEEQYALKQLLILKSSQRYQEALATAREASRSLGVKLNLRGLKENKRIGLTLDKNACEQDGGKWPCYYARGRWDDGEYISIEHSSAFQGFRKGFYIVVAASYPKADSRLVAALQTSRKVFPDAYAKVTRVYLGCMH